MGKDQNQSDQVRMRTPNRSARSRHWMAEEAREHQRGDPYMHPTSVTRRPAEGRITTEEAQPDAPRAICQRINWKGYRRKTIPVHLLRPARGQSKRAVVNRSDTDLMHPALTCRRPARKTTRLEIEIVKGNRSRSWNPLRTATGHTKKVLRKRLEGRALTGCAR